MALKFEITGDNKNLLSSLDGAREGVRNAAKDIEKSGLGIEEMFKRIATIAGITFSLDQAKSFIKSVMDMRGQFQQLEIAFNTMLQSEEKATMLMNQLVDTAAKTPFDLQGVAQGAKQLLAYGTAADEVNETITRLGDIAAGLSIPLGDLVYLYGTTMTQGRMFTQDLRQFMGRGIPMAEELAKQFGVTKDKVGELVTAGQIGADAVKKAIWNMTDEGGRFGGLMEAQSKSITGQLSNIGDAYDTMLNELGKSNEGLINSGLEGTKYLIENYKEVGRVILGLVAAYGEYKAALMVTNAIQKSMAKQSNEIEATRQAELQNIYDQFSSTSEVASEEASTSAILQNTASREGNVTAIDNQIAALERKMLAEIEEQNNIYKTARETLYALREQETQKDSEIDTLKKQIETSKESIESTKEAMESALSLGDAEQVEALKTNMATESERLNTLQAELGAAQKEKNIIVDQKHSAVIASKTALTQRQTMQEKLSNMQKAVSVAQTKAQTTATGLWIAVTKSATSALNTLKTAIMANPFGVALAAITTVITLLPMFSEETSKASEEIERFGENAVKQTRNLETLFAVVENTSKDSKVHKDAIDELCDIYEEYGFKIDDEIDKLDQLKTAHDLVTEAIKKEGEERQKANLLASYDEALKDATTNMRDTLQQAFEGAEWDASGWIDDWDAEEYQNKAKELTQIIGAIIQSEGDSLARLTGKELEDKIQEVNSRIEQAYKDMGLSLSKDFVKDGVVIDSPVDVNTTKIIRDYAEAIGSVNKGRDALIEGWKSGREAVKEEAEEVDYANMSISDLADLASKASDNTNKLGKLDVTPKINTSSINIAIGQTDTLLGNMYQLQSFGIGKGFIPVDDKKILANQELERRVKNATSQKKVDDLLKDVNEAFNNAEFDSDEYKFLENLKKRLEAKSRKKSGKSEKKDNSAEKIEKEQKRLEDLQDEIDTERLRSIEDMQTRLTQTRLNLMQDGAEKVRLLQEQQNKEEIDNLKRQREDAIKAYIDGERKLFEQQESVKKAQNSNYKEQKFDESSVDTSSISEQYDELIRLTEQNQLQQSYQENLRAMRDYLKEYGTLEQQRLAITQEYEEKIQQATSPTARASLMLERNNALEEFDAKQFEEKIDWAGIFSDLESHTQEYLIGLRDQLQGVLNEGSLTPEQMSVVQEKLRAINEEISKQNGLFQFQGDRAREHARLVQEAADAQALLTQAKQEEANAQMNVLNATEQIRNMLEGAGIDRDVDIDDGLLSQFDPTSEEYKKMAKLLETLRVSEGNLAKARRGTVDATRKAKNAEDASKRDSSQAIADWFSDAQQFIAEKGIDQIPDLLNEIGLGSVGEKVSKGLSGFNNAAGAAADFASGNYIGAAVKAISAVKDFGSALGIGGGNGKEVAETTERLTKANEKLTDRIADLTEAIGDSAGVRAIYAYETALEAQKEVNKNQMEILRAQMGYHAAHHSNASYADDSVIRSYNQSAQKAFKAAGVTASTISGLTSIYNLTPEQLKAIKDFAPDLWQYLLEVGKYDKSEYWEAVVENAGKTAELTEQINNNLTQTSFEDMRSSFLDTLTDMESDGDDFAKDLENMFFKAMVNSTILNDQFDDWLQSWRQRYAEAVKENNQRELENLRQEAVNMREQKAAERSTLAENLGYNGSSYKQEASSKGFQAMSQETGAELSGRFTAVQIAAENVGAQVVSIYSQMLLMAQTQTSSNNYLQEIRNMMITSNSYLEDIAKYSKKIYLDFAGKLDNIITNTK